MIPSGFAEVGEHELQEQVVQVARAHNILAYPYTTEKPVAVLGAKYRWARGAGLLQEGDVVLQTYAFRLNVGLLVLGVVIAFSAIDGRAADGPLGLQWGMPKAEVDALNIRLSNRQVGKWGTRYLVNPEDFKNFPNALGDEDKVYLYFGNTDKLLRIYVAIKKVDGWNRFKQVNALAQKKYTQSESCARQKYDKYEALTKGKSAETCKQYEAYTTYEQDSVEVFAGLEKFTMDYRISLIFLHGDLYRVDQGKKNPL